MMPNTQTIRYCDECHSRYTVSPDQMDYVHDCRVAADSTLQNEDVPEMGSWTDYTGTGGTESKQSYFYQGIVNSLQGTEAGIKGEDDEELTDRGNRESTHRTRYKLSYKEFTR